MKNDLALERYLYKEWESARNRSEKHEDAASRELAATGDTESKAVQFYERLAQLEWQHSVDILELIFEFEKGRAS